MTTITVDPRERYFPTGIEVKPGERYGFSAVGEWIDWTKRCDHTGWDEPGYRWFKRFNRVKGERFFRLCACIGKHDRHAFAIDVNQPWDVPRDIDTAGDTQLYLFANDLPSMYWNNRKLKPEEGVPLQVTITRLL